MNTKILSLALLAGASPAFAADPYPQGAVAHFNRSTGCPAGWSIYHEGRGRAVLPSAPQYAGQFEGDDLPSGEQPTHRHDYRAVFDPGGVSFAVFAGGANDGVANDNKRTAVGLTEPNDLRIPYVQYLVCRKDDTPPPQSSAPTGVVVFSASESGCAPGWIYADRLNGRLLVGVPLAGTAEAAFGGPPLSPAQPFPEHLHTIQEPFVLGSHGIGAVSPGGATGYGKKGAYTAVGLAEPMRSEFPYVMLTACQAP